MTALHTLYQEMKSMLLIKKGDVRQYGMEVEDEEKLARPGFNKWATNWLKTKDEKIYETSLAVKMVILALSKICSA